MPGNKDSRKNHELQVPGQDQIPASSLSLADKSKENAARKPAPSQDIEALEAAARQKPMTSIKGKVVFLVILLIAVCVASMCLSDNTYEIYGLDTAAHGLQVWIQTTFDTIVNGAHYTSVDLTALEPNCFQVRSRLGAVLISVLCGIVLTVSGTIYQSVFRNPVAAPTMLGVSSGLNLGIVLFVLVYGTAASGVNLSVQHYLFAYGGALIALVLVIGGSYLINGPKCFNVIDMLLIGSIISVMLSQVILYISYEVFTDEQWLTYTKLNEVMDVNTTTVAYLFLCVAFLVTMVPVILLRFRLNALSFDDEDTFGLGIDGTRLRYISIILATIMIIAALAHSGMVGMASLVVPYVSRAFFGAEFRKQLIGNMLIGAVLVVSCRSIASLLSIVLYHMGLTFDFPIGIVASMLCMPLFVWVVASQQKTWEQ